MDVINVVLLIIVAVGVGGSVAYLVWRALDRRDLDGLRGELQALESRLRVLEEDRSRKP
jgi:hypothetical protein